MSTKGRAPVTRRKQISRQLTQPHFEQLRQRAARTARSIAAIYGEDERHRIELIGSGVFFEHEGRHFVLSAGHVARDLRERASWIGGEDRAIPLTGGFYIAGDPLDLAFAPLSDEQVVRLSGVVFLSVRDVEPAGNPPYGSHYLVVGYVARDHVASSPIEGLYARWTALGAKASPPKRYEARRLDDSSHLLLTLNRRRTYTPERQETMPRINGMSGSGVWRMVDGHEELAAILIEHHDRKGNDIVATRISAMTNGLTRYVAQFPGEEIAGR